MRSSYKPFLFLLVWYAFSILSLVQLRSASAQDATPPAPSYEAEALAEQVELMRSYNQGMLDTVYWSLGTVATLAFLIVAYNWYTNNQIFEREKVAIKNELELLVRNGLKEESWKIHSGLSEELKKEIGNARREFDERLRILAIRTQRLYASAENEEAREWEERGSSNISFHLYLDILEHMDVFGDKIISEALDNLIHSIRRMKANGEEDLNTLELAKLKRLTENLPQKYSDSIRNIYKAIDEIPPQRATSVG